MRKVLKSDAPLLLKIRNGDFEYSDVLIEADRLQSTADEEYNLHYRNYGGKDENNRIKTANEARHRQITKAGKMREFGLINEHSILSKLRKALHAEFEIDLWDKAMETEPMTTEELYWWYKTQCNLSFTKSEMDISYKRANTKNLQHLF